MTAGPAARRLVYGPAVAGAGLMHWPFPFGNASARLCSLPDGRRESDSLREPLRTVHTRPSSPAKTLPVSPVRDPETAEGKAGGTRTGRCARLSGERSGRASGVGSVMSLTTSFAAPGFGAQACTEPCRSSQGRLSCACVRRLSIALRRTAHSGSWQNSVPCACRTQVLVSLLAAARQCLLHSVSSLSGA